VQDLELEQAELLPSRETLCCHRSSHGGNSFNFAQVGNGNVAQSGIGNVAIPVLNGSTIIVG